jgi:hypothetical protein
MRYCTAVMPTVLRSGGYRVYPVGVARNSGFTASELAEIVRLVQRSRSALMEAWDEFFR